MKPFVHASRKYSKIVDMQKLDEIGKRGTLAPQGIIFSDLGLNNIVKKVFLIFSMCGPIE